MNETGNYATEESQTQKDKYFKFLIILSFKNVLWYGCKEGGSKE